MSKIEHVFVYGTLRSKEQRAHVMGGCNKIPGEWRARGRLWSLGPFPAVELTEGNERVVGEVFQFNNNKDELLRQLDEIEGVSFGLFNRNETLVENNSGESLVCYIYTIGAQLANSDLKTLIPSGDWTARN